MFTKIKRKENPLTSFGRLINEQLLTFVYDELRLFDVLKNI